MPTLAEIAQMRATPRNKGLATLADLLSYVDQNVLRQQFGYSNPATGLISDILGVPAAARVANRLSYGEPITNLDKANVPLIPEDTAEAAMFAAPVVGMSGRLAEKGAMAAGRAGERYAEKVVPEIMQRGGMPAQLLQDLAQGTRHQMVIGEGGKLSSSMEDAMLAAEKIKSLGPEFVPKIEQASGGSVYLTVGKQRLTKSGEPFKRGNPTPIDFKARFADHPSYWGSSISSDPVTGNDVNTVVKMFEHKIGKSPEPNFTIARFNPADKYGTVEDIKFAEGVSHRGNPVIKRIVESRPFTFFEPKKSYDVPIKDLIDNFR
jgi:hypothetical protein